MATAKRRSPTRRPAQRQQKGKKSDSLGWRRSPITGVVALIVIGFCLYNLFIKDDSYMSRYMGDYVCRECRKVMRIGYIKGTAPHECPECKKTALHAALKCNACGEITANLPPVRDFTCNSCLHHEEVKLDPAQGPHECPKCHKSTFFESYECISCNHVFGRDTTLQKQKMEGIDLNSEDAEFMMEEFFFDEFVATCPKCNKPEAYPLIQDPLPTCEFCDSTDLSPITPVAVVKWELGRKLTEQEEAQVQRWREAQK